MTRDERDPLAVFDDDVVSRTAEETGVGADRIRSVARSHQQTVRDLPGVEDIVYEWRRSLPKNPLVERRTEAYFLAVDATVWGEYGDALSLSLEEFDALRALHANQLAATLGSDAAPDDGRLPLVLTRP
ncbi:hypothetical protein [Halopelagius longus]|uniref:DUF8048 domain-containing protein n=1 Tax=Halopelagius longus TaxID=1236180 RepID=A0A1H1BG08_9EURY|nr:hypothetical protein [Halopelagius longus]RDI70775.1 hypothetical protein DWB78_02970 [Halopelagius longus]SDQ50898.1 hypothetical protein SAMN05216278_1781 [Halopelagius longus]